MGHFGDAHRQRGNPRKLNLQGSQIVQSEDTVFVLPWRFH
jgi:hypothetical protein